MGNASRPAVIFVRTMPGLTVTTLIGVRPNRWRNPDRNVVNPALAEP
jgi:hypothetical protein